ncbi:MAG: hypothetical protein HQK77_08025 [Desulfobacterales bacterium]|nr:hypothetical protein [Desulfobacterales bacterium]
MSYKNFTLEKVIYDFSLELLKVPLFDNVRPISMSNSYSKILAKGLKIALPTGSEKIRNELIVMPILLEVQDINNEIFSIHSGVNLNVDKKKGLVGECDFVLSLSKITEFVDLPVFCIVEAEKQDIESGLGQCASQMVASRLLNQKRNKNIESIFGCVTTGAEWHFLKLQDEKLLLDSGEYYIRNVNELIGVFQEIVNYYKSYLKI